MRALRRGALGIALGFTFAAFAVEVPNRTLNVRLVNDIATLDWNRAHTNGDSLLIRQMMEGLFSVGARGQLVPDLCTRHTVSPDGKVYRFWIKKGVKWSDGVELTAKDFIFSWRRLTSPLTAADKQHFLKDAEFSALADDQLEVRIARPIAHMLWIFAQTATYPLREDVVQRHGEGWATPGRIVTLGPFQLESITAGRDVVMRRHPQYWRKIPGNVDRIVARFIREDNTAENLFVTGKLDFFYDFGAMVLQRHLKDPGLRWFDPLRTYYLGLSSRMAPLLWPDVRQALAQGVDKSGFAKLLQGGQKPASSFVPPGLVGYLSDVGLPLDIRGARYKIQQTQLTASNRVIEMAILSSDKMLLIGEYLQGEYARNLGLKITLKPYDSKTFYGLLGTKSFPLFLGGWSADFPDGDDFLQNLVTGGAGGRSLYASAEYDRLIAEQRATMDPTKRLALLRAAQKLLLEKDIMLIPLFYDRTPALLAPRVHAPELGPGFSWRFADWSL